MAVLGVAWFFPHALDVPVHQALPTLYTPMVEQMWDVVAHLGNGWVIAPVCLTAAGFGYWSGRHRVRETALRCFAAYALSGIAAQGVKRLLGRPRPRLIDDPTAGWGPSFSSGFDAFPSGHTTSAFALAAVLSHYYPRGRIVFILLACLVATARVVRGSHWITDVVAGALLGTLIGVWIAAVTWEQLRWRAPTPPT